MTDTTAPDAITQAANPWQQAVVDALCCAHVYRAEHDSDPKGALNDLLIWERQVSLDPAVSQDVRDLLAAHGAGEGLREAWRTGHNIPAVDQRHRDAAAWALDRAPDGMTWDHLTAAHVTPERRWQAHRVAEAFARFERSVTPPTDAGSTTREGGEGVLAEREACARIADQLADDPHDIGAKIAARIRNRTEQDSFLALATTSSPDSGEEK